MFKVGDIVICIDCHSNSKYLVYGNEYIVTDVEGDLLGLKDVLPMYFDYRFKLKEPMKVVKAEFPPKAETTIEVGSPIVVNYVKGPYNVVNYKTTVLKVATSYYLSGPLYTFKAPDPEHGNPIPSEIWSLTAPHVVLDTEDKPFAIGDKVLIVKEWQPFSGDTPTVGQIGVIRSTDDLHGRARIAVPDIGTNYWYEPGDFVHYTEGMAVPKEAKPRKIINPRKEA